MPRRRYRDNDSDDEDDNVFTGQEPDADDEQFADEEEPVSAYDNPTPEQPRREFKYSTASLQEEGACKKYCLILGSALLMLAAMIGLSMLMQHFFFSDTSDNAIIAPERDPNSTFPLDKTQVDQACSKGTMAADDGKRCAQTCRPQFFECCDPFDEFNLYGGKGGQNELELDSANNNNNNNMSVAPSASPTTMAHWLGENHTQTVPDNCTFDQNVRGCVAYSKCQASAKLIPPAPAVLPELCSPHRLALDPVSCQEQCKLVRCCYSRGTDHCMADNLDVCLDYAPCQNLREGFNLPAAPMNLDELCLWQDPVCNQECEKAACCGDAQSLCLQEHFISCLSYAACNDVTRTKITIAPAFSMVPKPPAELLTACGEYHELLQKVDRSALPAEHSCKELCDQVSCCFDAHNSCWFQDPLGCAAWDQQCQVLRG